MSRPSQIRFLSRFAGAYDPVVRLMGFPSLWRGVADVAAPRLGEPALDVCTGSGGVALELARRGARVIGIDLAGGMLRRAHRKRDAGALPNVTFLQMDGRRLAFRDRSFPLVTTAMALHEMAEVEREHVLREIVRVASHRVVIAEYHLPRDPTRRLWFRAGHLFEYLESDDFHSFVQRDFGERLEQAGLTVRLPKAFGGYRVWSCLTHRA